MASRTTVTLVDDLDGSEAEQSVSFGLEGIDYEIDLSGAHAQALRELLAPYAAAARRTGGRRGTSGSTASSRAAHRNTGPGRSRTVNAEIRAWAAEHGVVLAERGRIPSRVVEAYEAGDPTRLPSAGTDASSHEAPTSATSGPTPAAPPEEDQPRGRDGLTATERETIRAWATDQGIEVKTRGQLKKDLISNYRAWQSRPS